MSSDLDRALAECQEAEAMIRAGQANRIVNGHPQPMHSLFTWMADHAKEAELIRKEYAMARASGKAL